jgi:hypothetical protein
MKSVLKSMSVIVVVTIFALPVFPQGRPGSTDRDHGAGAGPSVSAAASVSSAPASFGSYGSREVSTSRDFGSRGSYGSGSVSGGPGRGVSAFPPPQLKGTSFTSLNSFYAWQDFYFYLQMHYMMNRMYFLRFYRNIEPLITPQMVRLTVREPLTLAVQMMTAVDQLETMLQARQAGGPVSKEDIADKAQEIRALAKQIRSNEALTFVDQRKDTDVLKDNNIETRGLEAVSQLREMIVDLNSQLKGMYTQQTTSTVSVNSLTQPSLRSLSKGIEKLSRSIENSAKKI